MGKGQKWELRGLAAALLVVVPGAASGEASGEMTRGTIWDSATRIAQVGITSDVDELRFRIGREVTPGQPVPVQPRDTGVDILPATPLPQPEERQVPLVEREEDQPSPTPEATSGVFAPSELAPRLDEVRACRGELAAARHTASSDILVGDVELRWTIGDDGSTTAPEVVAIQDTDPDMLTCAQRKMSEWRFDQAYGRSFSVRLPLP